VTAKGGVIDEVAGHEAGPAAGQATAQTPAAKSSGGASKGLGIAALIVGALGLVLAVVALLALRRARTAA
jgi:hypothetical protein